MARRGVKHQSALIREKEKDRKDDVQKRLKREGETAEIFAGKR